jgi:glutamine synthetase
LGVKLLVSPDGSSIRGFTAQRESDLRLGIDWPSFYWGPADIFDPGKVLVFGDVIDKGGAPYAADIRGVLKTYADKLFQRDGLHSQRRQRDRGLSFRRRPSRAPLS